MKNVEGNSHRVINLEVVYAKNPNLGEEPISFSVELNDYEISLLKKALKNLKGKTKKSLSKIIKRYETMKFNQNNR